MVIGVPKLFSWTYLRRRSQRAKACTYQSVAAFDELGPLKLVRKELAQREDLGMNTK
jgi:hypothetical protein